MVREERIEGLTEKRRFGQVTETEGGRRAQRKSAKVERVAPGVVAEMRRSGGAGELVGGWGRKVPDGGRKARPTMTELVGAGAG